MRAFTTVAVTAMAFIAGPSPAQTLDWVAAAYNAGANSGSRIEADSDGNVVSTGSSPGRVSFVPGGTWSFVRDTNVYYAYKLGPAREFHWYARIEGARGAALAIDPDDNVVFGSGTFPFDSYVVPALGPEIYVDTNARAALLWKLAADGSTRWLRQFPSTERGASIGAVLAREDGGIIAAGRFSGSIELEQPPASRVLTSRGDGDVFVVAVDGDGGFLWARQLGGSGVDLATDLAMSLDGSIVVAGTFTADITIGDDAAQMAVVNQGGSDGFLARFGADGAFHDAGGIGGSGADAILGLDIDPSGKLAVVGTFSGVADLDPGENVDQRTSAGVGDAFASLLNEDGSIEWTRTWGGTQDDSARSVRLGSGKVQVGGFFGGSVDFDPGTGSHATTAAGIEDGFVLRMDRAGSFEQLVTIGGTSGLVGSDRVYGLGLDAVGDLLVTGAFARAVDFDPSDGTHVVTGGQSADGFVWKLHDAGALVVQNALTPQPLGFGQSATLSIMLASTIDVDLDELSMLQDLPSSLRIAGDTLPSACGGQLEAVPGESWFSLAGAYLAAGSSCSIDVEVVAVATGTSSVETAPGSFGNAQEVWPLAGASTSFEVSPAASSLQWTVQDPMPSLPGQPVSFGVDVVVATGEEVPGPEGTIALTSADSSCTIELPGTTCELVFAHPGMYEVSASYGGDGNFLPSAGSIAHEVSRAASSLQWIVHDPSPSRPGQPVSFGVHVVAQGGDTQVPEGTVILSSADSTCTIELPAASCELVFEQPGSHEVTAAYGGDAYFLPSKAGIGHDVVALADVAITIEGAAAVWTAASDVAFGLRIANAGPDHAVEVEIAAAMAAFESVSWTCMSGCQGSGQGGVKLTAAIPPGESVVIGIQARAPDSSDSTITVSATATPGAYTLDAEPADNMATHVAWLALFRNGFD